MGQVQVREEEEGQKGQPALRELKKVFSPEELTGHFFSTERRT